MQPMVFVVVGYYMNANCKCVTECQLETCSFLLYKCIIIYNLWIVSLGVLKVPFLRFMLYFIQTLHDSNNVI